MRTKISLCHTIVKRITINGVKHDMNGKSQKKVTKGNWIAGYYAKLNYRHFPLGLQFKIETV
jgi:hypothetical protein